MSNAPKGPASTPPKGPAPRPRSPSEALEPSRAPARPRAAKIRGEPRKASGFVRFLSTVFSLSLVLMAGAGAIGFLMFHQFEKPGPLEVTRTIAVPKGEGRIEIAARLEREGVISNRWVFVASHLYASTIGPKRGAELKAGEFEIKKGSSMRQVLDTLTEGKSVLYKVTIPEGLTSLQITERLKADPNLSGDIATVPAEGTLLPDTYRFSKGMSRQDLLDRMRAEQQKVLAAAWEKRQSDLPVTTPEQALVLASIIEKETGRADERDRVAAVFVNRLRQRMRLQSDPTIIYGIVGGAGTLGRPILRSDIDQKTAFNTYQIDGLPPTPICNPGRSAIEATLNPAKTKDLYFVADGSGGHTFSETLKDHNAAVANWRKVEKEAKAAKQDTPVQPAAAQQRAVSRPAPPPAGAVVQTAPAAEEAATPPTTAEPAPAAAAAVGAVPLPVRKPKK